MGESPWASMSASIWERASAARASNWPPSTWASSTVKSWGSRFSRFTSRRYQGASSCSSGAGEGEGSQFTEMPGVPEFGALSAGAGEAAGWPLALAVGIRWGSRHRRKTAQALPTSAGSSQRPPRFWACLGAWCGSMGKTSFFACSAYETGKPAGFLQKSSHPLDGPGAAG